MENNPTTTILLIIISVLLTLMTIFCGSILLSMRNFKSEIKKEVDDFIKEFRPIVKEFSRVQAQHEMLTGDGQHPHKFPIV